MRSTRPPEAQSFRGCRYPGQALQPRDTSNVWRELRGDELTHEMPQHVLNGRLCPGMTHAEGRPDTHCPHWGQEGNGIRFCLLSSCCLGYACYHNKPHTFLLNTWQVSFRGRCSSPADWSLCQSQEEPAHGKSNIDLKAGILLYPFLPYSHLHLTCIISFLLVLQISEAQYPMPKRKASMEPKKQDAPVCAPAGTWTLPPIWKGPDFSRVAVVFVSSYVNQEWQLRGAAAILEAAGLHGNLARLDQREGPQREGTQ